MDNFTHYYIIHNTIEKKREIKNKIYDRVVTKTIIIKNKVIVNIFKDKMVINSSFCN